MRYTIVASLLFSSAVLAAPSASSKPFIIGVTIPGVPTHYLGKSGDGYGVTDIKQAQTCVVDEKTQLVCGKDKSARPVIVGSIAALNDMVPLKTNFGQDLTTGFSLDGRGLHWRNEKFSLQQVIKEKQGGEANWALYPDKDHKRYQLYAQLGCPSEPDEKHAFHNAMVPGKQTIVYP